MEINKEALNLVVDVRILPVGTNVFFAVTPQMIHRIQMRTPLGQPQKLDATKAGQRLRTMCGVTALFIEDHSHLVTTIMRMNQVQECLKALLAMVVACHEQSPARPDIDHAKGYPLG